jgi:hypothetical protein
MHAAVTIYEVEKAAQVRREATGVLQSFENTGTAQNLRHHARLGLDQTYDFFATKERSSFKNTLGILNNCLI